MFANSLVIFQMPKKQINFAMINDKAAWLNKYKVLSYEKYFKTLLLFSTSFNLKHGVFIHLLQKNIEA